MEVFRDERGRRDRYIIMAEMIKIAHKPATVYDFMKAVGGRRGEHMRRFAEELVNYGLLRKIVHHPPARRLDAKDFYLATEKGKQFLSLVNELKKIWKKPRS